MVKVRAARLLPRYGTDHDHFNTLVWTEAGVLVDESLEAVAAAVRPRKGASALCSGCHQPAPGYDQLAERRFESIPLWGDSLSSCCTRCGVSIAGSAAPSSSKRFGVQTV